MILGDFNLIDNHIPKKVLIYSPHVGGHKQVYCNVITDWALGSGMEVFLYVGNDWCNSKKRREEISPYIGVYIYNTAVSIISSNVYEDNHIISLSNFKQNPLSASDSRNLIELEKKFNPDLVFVISGDEFNHSPYSLLKSLFSTKKHSSKWIGIFISPYCYPSDNWFKRNILKVALKQKIKYFDTTFWLDEYFLKSRKTMNSFWLPDISKSFNYKDDIDEDTDSLCIKIDNFLMNNKEKEILLFFGGYFIRKGFDFLLELALNDKQFVILRAGDTSESDRSPEFVDKMAMLENRNQLLNIPQFIKSSVVTRKLFEATKYIPLPYRNHYSSSGVMLQALEFGKPVIVPDIGLMGKRVIHNNIGITYKHGDYEDFKCAVYRMQKHYSRYADNVSNYYLQYSKENIFEHLNIIIKKS